MHCLAMILVCRRVLPRTCESCMVTKIRLGRDKLKLEPRKRRCTNNFQPQATPTKNLEPRGHEGKPQVLKTISPDHRILNGSCFASNSALGVRLAGRLCYEEVQGRSGRPHQ